VSSKLSADLKSVTADLGNIAVAIQFHDITRQQVEHVVQALEGLLPERSSAGEERDSPGKIGGGESISSSGGALVRLQQAQLASAAASFADSTRQIGSDLEDIGARVEEMAQASNRIQGFDQESNSFLGVMQSRFGAIAQAVTDLHTLERGTRATVADLEHASRDMRAAVGEVQSIESQLNLLSINGVVSATRLGAQGQVLIAIAGAIGELRRASAARSGEAEAALHSIGEAIGSLAGSGESVSREGFGAQDGAGGRP
jgi:methyl-accepting chemotaxis protein